MTNIKFKYTTISSRVIKEACIPHIQGTFCHVTQEHFSENEELWKEEPHMFSLSHCIYEDGFDDGKEKGIKAVIQNNLSEGISRGRTIANLKKFFELTEERSEKYYDQFAGEM